MALDCSGGWPHRLLRTAQPQARCRGRVQDASETARALAHATLCGPRGQWIRRRMRETFGIDQRQLADRVPAGTHRGDGDQARSRASQTMEDISHARWGDAEEKEKP